MGVDYTVHVGPYVACKNERVDLKKTRRSCTNSNCKRYKDHIWDMINFCSACGKGIGQVDYVEKGDKVSVDSEELNEDLYPCPVTDKGMEYWLPNKERTNKDSRSFSFDPKYDENFVEELSPEEIANDLKEFKEQYKDAIAKLVKEFGKDNAKVKWGIISYAC
jgi:hypothetical protein